MEGRKRPVNVKWTHTTVLQKQGMEFLLWSRLGVNWDEIPSPLTMAWRIQITKTKLKVENWSSMTISHIGEVSSLSISHVSYFLLAFYRDMNFESMITLPDSDKYDCVVCACVADVDWDGVNELVLGTYGQVGSIRRSPIRVIKGISQSLVMPSSQSPV